MPTIKIKKAFKFSEDGLTVDDFEPGGKAVSDLCAKYAKSKGFLVETKAEIKARLDAEAKAEKEKTDAEVKEETVLGKPAVAVDRNKLYAARLGHMTPSELRLHAKARFDVDTKTKKKPALIKAILELEAKANADAGEKF
ncbi:MAG: hypothetical protein JEY79_14010 [Pseudodesulfovibrio sp.]|nr:hypothetical protein [Pseudodesulfovibrio sp.]